MRFKTWLLGLSLACGLAHAQSINNYAIVIIPEWRGMIFELPAAYQVDNGTTHQTTVQFVMNSLDKGWFSINFPQAGTYTIRLKAHGFLSQYRTVTVSASGSDSFYFGGYVNSEKLIPGDANNDNRIDDFDLAAVIFDFGHPMSGQHGFTDFNADLKVDDYDLADVIFNFGKSGN